MIAAAILVGAFALPGLVRIQEAEAYDMYTCKFDVSSSETIYYKFDSSVTSNYYKDLVRNGAAKLNDAGIKFKLVENNSASTKVITISQYSAADGAHGQGTIGGCVSPGYIATVGTVQLNNYYLSTSTRDHIIAVVVHEFGHALGLKHYGTYTMMKGDVSTIRMAATLDDYAGLKAKYGLKTPNFTALCALVYAGGSVTYTGGSCSTSNPGYPVTMRVTTAGAGNNAAIYTSSSTSTMPSWNCLDTSKCADSKDGTLVMTARVKATTLNKFSMGVYTNRVISDTQNRVMTIEMNSNGFYLVMKDPNGSLMTKTISSTAPTVGQEYFLVLVIDKNSNSRAYVLEWEGSAIPPATGPEPTMIGNDVSDFTANMKVRHQWTTQVYYGMGVWMPSGSGPLPNYQVIEYHNLLRTYN